MPSTSDLLEDAALYAEQQKVFQLFEGLLADLVVHKPTDPISHLIKVLKRDAVPRVVVAGPPGAQARSICELLAAKKGLVHVIATDVWRELARLDVEAGKKAKALHDAGEPVPWELTLQLLEEKLRTGECVTRGWVLEGFPADAAQARAMLGAGLLPTRFLHIGVDDAEVMRRLTGRRVDPVANVVYHLQDAPPPDQATVQRLVHREEDTYDNVAARLLAYRKSMAGALAAFPKVLVELDGSLPGEAGVSKLLELALPTITADMPTRAPRGSPRVLLLGGPGANADVLGRALSQRYGAKLISAIELLHGAALSGSKGAMKAMKAEFPLVAGEDLIGPLVLSRLAQEDVRLSGFILQGFPVNAAHAALLRKNKVWIRDAVHLDVAPAAAEATLCGTRYDPLDGDIYHLDDPPADDALQRLVVHPQHTPDAVKRALRAWEGQKGGLLKAYADVLRTEDAARPERELVERLAPCFLAL